VSGAGIADVMSVQGMGVPLSSCSIEDVGRELARRVEQRWRVCRDMAERAAGLEDLVELANCAEGSLWAAQQASDMAIAASALLGAGDARLVERARLHAREAAASSSFCTSRWSLVRRLRGKEARA
jgi:hypothetical protein